MKKLLRQVVVVEHHFHHEWKAQKRTVIQSTHLQVHYEVLLHLTGDSMHILSGNMHIECLQCINSSMPLLQK